LKTYAFIFARGGSKGVPRKNIRELAGKPLLKYSIDSAKAIKSISKIFVSTDDNEIANIARQNGAIIIERPLELAKDDTPEWLAWNHAIEWLKNKGDSFDIFLSLPTTSPLRSKRDIKKSIDALDDSTDIVVTMTSANRSPWFNMVKKNSDGYVKLLLNDDKRFHRRQDPPKVFDLTTVAYVTRPKFIQSANGVFDGNVSGVMIPRIRALDIDTELDFEIAECLIKKLTKE
tara:strand:+ start:199 stop:891 length:693 start_codon:yes stop_codon:yes gene_type:complete